MCTFLCSMGMWADSGTKVTVEPTDWSGEYFLVAEESGVLYGFTNTVSSKWGVCEEIPSSDITGNTITPSSTSKVVAVAIEKEGNGYKIKSTGNNYLKGTTGNMTYATSGYVLWTLALQNDGTVLISSGSGTDMLTLQYNHYGGSGGFRVYKSNGQTKPYLYKKSSTTVTFNNLGFASWGKDAQFSGDVYTDVEQTIGGVKFTYTKKTGSIYANNSAIRFYKDNELTFDAPNGYTITSIEFAGSSWKDDVTTDVITCTSSSSGLSWVGNSKSVTFTRPDNASGYIQLSSVSVTLAKTFDLNVGSCGWASMYLDFNAKVPEDVTAYYAASVEDEIITLKSVKAGEVLPMNTGVLVNGTSCTFAESSDVPATVTGNLFEGVTVATACDPRTVWVLNATETANLGDPVLSLYTGTTLGAHKAYLPASSVSGAKSLKLVFDDDATVTSINAVTNTTANSVAYNLAGQRVAANTKGIVIMNGKKFINK